MSFPTIIGLEAAVTGQRDYLTLIEQDHRALGRLEGLHQEAQQVTTVEGEKALAHSFETIARTTPTLREDWSFESNDKRTIFQQIVHGIKMLIEAIARNARRLLDWINDIMIRSKGRRNKLTERFKELKKQVGSQGRDAVYIPVLITPQQASFVFEDGHVPAHMEKALERLVAVYTQLRKGRSTRLITELAKISTSGNLVTMDLNAVFTRIQAIFTSNDIQINHGPKSMVGGTPKGSMVAVAAREPIAVLLGNATVWLKKPVSGGVEQYGYEVVPDEFAPPKETVTVDLTDPVKLTQVIELNLSLVQELDQLSDQIAATKPHLELSRRVLDRILKEVDFDVDNEKVQNIRKAVQYTDIIMKTMSVFPAQLYTHGMRVASSQAVLLGAVVNTGK